MEGDKKVILLIARKNTFQSTPSAWRETLLEYHARIESGISIHSLRMEGDETVRNTDV